MQQSVQFISLLHGYILQNHRFCCWFENKFTIKIYDFAQGKTIFKLHMVYTQSIHESL